MAFGMLASLLAIIFWAFGPGKEVMTLGNASLNILFPPLITSNYQ
jgi:hypothetical protein